MLQTGSYRSVPPVSDNAYTASCKTKCYRDLPRSCASLLQRSQIQGILYGDRSFHLAWSISIIRHTYHFVNSPFFSDSDKRLKSLWHYPNHITDRKFFPLEVADKSRTRRIRSRRSQFYGVILHWNYHFIHHSLKYDKQKYYEIISRRTEGNGF
jgi:hypothetical protein